jgi:hypothetical protein
MASWFPDLSLGPETTAQTLMAAMNVRYIEDSAGGTYFNYYAEFPRELDVAGFQKLYQVFLWGSTEAFAVSEASPFDVRYDKENMQLTVEDTQGHRAVVDLSALVHDLLSAGIDNQVPAEETYRLTAEAEDGPIRLRVTAVSLEGRETANGIEIDGGQVQVLVGTAAAPAE